jgi:hypothetical protein
MNSLLEFIALFIVCCFLALILPACKTNAYHGIATVQIHTNTLNTQQPCSTDSDVLKLADLAAVFYLEAAARAKLIDYEKAAKTLKKNPRWVCLIKDRESCRIGSVCSLGSDGQGGYKPDCSPKAGCAGDGWAWAIDSSTLVHELGHVLGLLWGIQQSPDHHGAWYGIEAQVQSKLRAAGFLP